MLTRLKELIFALMLSPAVYYWGFEGSLLFGAGLSLYVISHVARDFEETAGASKSSDS